MNVKQKVFEAFENVGIVVDENLNENLIDVIEDSLMYVSLIVELETMFGIEIPAEYLNIDNIETTDALILLIEQLQEEKN